MSEIVTEKIISDLIRQINIRLTNEYFNNKAISLTYVKKIAVKDITLKTK